MAVSRYRDATLKRVDAIFSRKLRGLVGHHFTLWRETIRTDKISDTL
eukprot:COSAG05_NODE_22313_length_265_cov_1.554217_1_plen_46_part_10